jgi:hypothetical protein
MSAVTNEKEGHRNHEKHGNCNNYANDASLGETVLVLGSWSCRWRLIIPRIGDGDRSCGKDIAFDANDGTS